MASVTWERVAAGDVLIRTVDMQRAMAAVQPLLQFRESFVLVGPEGCGACGVFCHPVP